MDKRQFGICILAAGFSSRMGKFKPLLPLNDETVLERVLRVSKDAGIRQRVVVTGYNREALVPLLERSGAVEVRNPRFEEGMFTSIQAGISALPRNLDGFFVLPVDCPLVTKEVLMALKQSFAPDKFSVPCYRGKKGHPLLIPAMYRQAILRHDGTGGLKEITDKDYGKIKRIEVREEGVVMDMDTPRAYEKIKEWLAGKGRFEDFTELAKGRRFFLVRHGQIRQHKEKIFLGQTDVPLSEKGQLQAEEAADRLAGFSPQTDRVYTSDLLRASQTAEILRGKSGLAHVIEEKGLREMNLGSWDGRFIREIKEEFPEEYEKRGQNLMIYKQGRGSENFFDLQYRVIKTLIGILRKDPSPDVIVTAHSGVLRAIANNLEGKDISDSWDKMGNGELRVLCQGKSVIDEHKKI